jgi:hypothetical protein
MKRYLLAALLVGMSAVPVSAATFYVMFDKTTKKCSLATTPPTETEKFSMMGQYGSKQAAMDAMSTMKECKR